MSAFGKLLRPLRAGSRDLTWNRFKDVPETIAVTSTAFADGAPMPRRYAGSGVGDNVSPPLRFSGVSDDATELVLIVQDIDVPLPRPAVHLIAQLPASRTDLPEAALRSDAPVTFGRGTLGRGYLGPRPIAGHGPHRYVFQVFALIHPLHLPPSAGLRAYVAAMKGKVLARGRMSGTYERR